MAVRPSLPSSSITLHQQQQQQQQQQHFYSVSTLAYQKQSVLFKLRETLVANRNRHLLNWCMITKVTLQLRAPADEVLHAQSVQSQFQFSDDKQKLGSVCSV